MLCASWVPNVESCKCSVADFQGDGAAQLETWLLIASTVLYAASGRQYPGVCSDLVELCAEGSGRQWLDYPADGGARPLPVPGCRCGDPGPSCVCWIEGVLLPYNPVRRIIAVTVGGEVVDPSAYQLVNRRRLRHLRGAWPLNGTALVEYEWGRPPPPGGAEMASIYACELAKGCLGDESCQLPRRVTSIVRENVSMTVLDPFDFLDDGRTGVYEIDVWLRAMNPQKADRPGKVLNPDLIQTRRTS